MVRRGERHLLRRALRSRRSQELRLHLVRDEVAIPVIVRTVGVVRNGRLVATEGVARLARGRRSDDAPAAGPSSLGSSSPASRAEGATLNGQFPSGSLDGSSADEPVQQRLAALMFEVHALLHKVLPARPADATDGRTLMLGDLALDVERLTVTESGAPVPLTTREVLLLRYLLHRPGRVVTRQQLLTDVWGYHFTGDDRTVDVHISRLRKKLPSLKGHLVAIRNIGYRIDAPAERKVANG